MNNSHSCHFAAFSESHAEIRIKDFGDLKKAKLKLKKKKCKLLKLKLPY